MRAPRNEIIASMPGYFDPPPNNCNPAGLPEGVSEDEAISYYIWNSEANENVQTEFYQTLVSGNGSEAAQKWFDGFDIIVNTLTIE